jgi:hypothetical protein
MGHLRIVLAAAAALLSVGIAEAQQPQGTPPPLLPPGAIPTGLLPEKPDLQPKALDILKAASAKLAGARTMSFTAIAIYESAARTLQPLAYTVRSDVTLQRPDKLRVLTPADGPPSEFYYDGKQMMAFEPTANLVAIAEAPPTIDEMLKVAYEKAAITFPFDDVIIADPYKDLGPGLKLAFYIGQSHVVGNTVTDIVGVANGVAQAQIWIGAEDKLPRLIRVIYFNEPGNYRHVVEFLNWRIDPAIPPGTFTSARAAAAKRIPFAAPDDKPPQK